MKEKKSFNPPFSSPERIRHIGELIVYACIRRPSTFSNFTPEAVKLILSIFTYSIYRQGERIMVFLFFNRMRTLIAMVTYSCH